MFRFLKINFDGIVEYLTILLSMTQPALSMPMLPRKCRTKERAKYIQEFRISLHDLKSTPFPSDSFATPKFSPFANFITQLMIKTRFVAPLVHRYLKCRKSVSPAINACLISNTIECTGVTRPERSGRPLAKHLRLACISPRGDRSIQS